MRMSVLAALTVIGIGLLGVWGASAFPRSILPTREAATASASIVEANYYYNGRYYPYRYQGHYYSYRYRGGYYHYRYRGHYYNYRNCGWMPSHHYRCNYW